MLTKPFHKSNLAAVFDKLHNIGFVSKGFHLCPTMFGLPQSRNRVYIAVVRATLLEKLGTDANAFNAMLTEKMAMLTNHPLMLLDAFLLPESAPEVDTLYTRLPATAKSAEMGKIPEKKQAVSGVRVREEKSGI